MNVLTINCSNGETLPVFNFKEEAEMFLRRVELRTSWRVRQTTPGELLSMLYASCAGVEKVALDPPPPGIVREALVGLVSLSRNNFVRALMEDGRAELRRRPLWAKELVVPATDKKAEGERGC
jgi:hypothetical protein